jgi:hypothetical protein
MRQPLRRQLPQFVIDERQQLIGRLRIALAHRVQDPGDVFHQLPRIIVKQPTSNERGFNPVPNAVFRFSWGTATHVTTASAHTSPDMNYSDRSGTIARSLKCRLAEI